MGRSTRGALALFGAALTLVSGCGSDGGGGTDTSCQFRTDADDISVPPIHTPRWAFEPWISKDISDAADTRAFVAGFADRDIPVGAVVIDSPWETQYNTFEPNPSRYPDFAGLVNELHGQDIRVVMWITQMVNETSVNFEPGGDTYDGASPNYDEASKCGFLINDGDGYLWWKGVGAGVNFFDPEAVAWLRRQEDKTLALGIDGWKLDFGDQYIPGPQVYDDNGAHDHQEYSEAYYRDFWAYGVSVRGPDFVTMVRPWDESYGFPGRFYARPENAPVTWVGDNRRDWIGVDDALNSIFRSADAGYAVIGSDIGGYLDFNDVDQSEMIPFSTLVFARWTAMSALMPFFQLHGRANIAPWTVPDNVNVTVEMYRYWATLHHELVPFFYSLAEEAYAGGEPIIRPQGQMADWAEDYRFVVGNTFLVAPILDDTGVRDVLLPSGQLWINWWDQTQAADGGQMIRGYDATDRRRYPIYVRKGAIVPAHVSSDVTGLGDAASAGKLTVAAWPDRSEQSFPLHDDDDQVTTIAAKLGQLTLSRALAPVIARVLVNVAPTSVMSGGTALTEAADRAAFDGGEGVWLYDSTAKLLWISVGASAGPVTLTWQ